MGRWRSYDGNLLQPQRLSPNTLGPLQTPGTLFKRVGDRRLLPTVTRPTSKQLQRRDSSTMSDADLEEVSTLLWPTDRKRVLLSHLVNTDPQGPASPAQVQRWGRGRRRIQRGSGRAAQVSRIPNQSFPLQREPLSILSRGWSLHHTLSPDNKKVPHPSPVGQQAR